MCENWFRVGTVERLRKNPAPWARKSLAQHGAAGGVLGRVANVSESRRDDRCSHTPSKGQFSRGLLSARMKPGPFRTTNTNISSALHVWLGRYPNCGFEAVRAKHPHSGCCAWAGAYPYNERVGSTRFVPSSAGSTALPLQVSPVSWFVWQDLQPGPARAARSQC